MTRDGGQKLSKRQKSAWTAHSLTGQRLTAHDSPLSRCPGVSTYIPCMAQGVPVHIHALFCDTTMTCIYMHPLYVNTTASTLQQEISYPLGHLDRQCFSVGSGCRQTVCAVQGPKGGLGQTLPPLATHTRRPRYTSRRGYLVRSMSD